MLEESLDLKGLWIRIVDTARLWMSMTPLGRAAMERTSRSLEESELCLWVLDGGEGFLEDDAFIFDQLKGKKVVCVVNKIDLSRLNDVAELKKRINEQSICYVSAKTGEGIDVLEKKIVDVVFDNELGGESIVVTRLRHKNALDVSLQALEKSFQSFCEKESLEFVILDLKQSLDALKELVGEVYSEDLLDVIFSEFCIGK